jgi:hypothetical protein
VLVSCAVCVVSTTAIVNSSADLPVKALTLSWVCPSTLSIFTKYIRMIGKFVKKRCFLGIQINRLSIYGDSYNSRDYSELDSYRLV